SLHSDKATEDVKKKLLADLHKTFATLTQEEQKYANIFLHDVERGDVIVGNGKSLRDYITEYQEKAKNDRIHKCATALGVNETMLRTFLNLHVTEGNINEFGQFDNLKASVNSKTAKAYFEATEGAEVPLRKVQMKIDIILRQFVLTEGFEV
ncbi:MAG: type I restriction endonuclease subunit R, partial [Rikenellaceae bacterium]